MTDPAERDESESVPLALTPEPLIKIIINVYIFFLRVSNITIASETAPLLNSNEWKET